MSTAATAPPCVPADRHAAQSRSHGHGAVAGGSGARAVWLLAGILLPLAAFAALATSTRTGPPTFDLILLEHARLAGGGRLDAAWLVITRLGYEWGVVPGDFLLVAVLLVLRRWRGALFAAVALGGSGLLNVAAKQLFSRVRPDLWIPIAPEHNFSFPSGHAMGSITLAWVLVLLAWRTRWRWPVAVTAAGFVAAVGWSRVHLGVHYPSDILAGWTLATAWVMACRAGFFRGDRPA